MKTIFVSYSSKNEKLAKAFVELLQLGMGFAKNDIFCTAYPYMLETGNNFIEDIRNRMRECETVISIITDEYLRSSFCLAEMGAAWALSKRYFPLLMVPYERLDGTPLQGLQMRNLKSLEDLSIIYDELHKCKILESYQTAEFYKRAEAFVKGLKANDYTEDSIINKDSDGYYEAVISSVRPVNNKQYRCYGLLGHISEPPDGEKADNDWLFYWRNAFPDLQVGDRVRFKTTKTKINKFPDLGRARNIYPDDLFKV